MKKACFLFLLRRFDHQGYMLLHFYHFRFSHGKWTGAECTCSSRRFAVRSIIETIGYWYIPPWRVETKITRQHFLFTAHSWIKTVLFTTNHLHNIHSCVCSLDSTWNAIFLVTYISTNQILLWKDINFLYSDVQNLSETVPGDSGNLRPIFNFYFCSLTEALFRWYVFGQHTNSLDDLKFRKSTLFNAIFQYSFILSKNRITLEIQERNKMVKWFECFILNMKNL